MRWIPLVFALLLPGASMAAAEPAKSIAAGGDKPIEISADSLEVIQPEQIAIFRGNVIAVQGDVRIKSEIMRVFYTKKDSAEAPQPSATPSPAPGGGAISRIEVEQNVQMATPEEAASSRKGEYQVDGKLITLTGDVVLTRGQNVLKGEKLVYNLGTGKSLLTAAAASGEGKTHAPAQRVRGVFMPNSK